MNEFILMEIFTRIGCDNAKVEDDNMRKVYKFPIDKIRKNITHDRDLSGKNYDKIGDAIFPP